MPREKRHANGLTIKEQKFCHAYIETGNASHAYRMAYNCIKSSPETIKQNAYMVGKRPAVIAYIEFMKDQNARKSQVSVDRLTAELEDIRQVGMKNEDLSPAVAAINGKAKLHGLMTDKIDHTSGGKPIEPSTLSLMETAKGLAFILAKAGKAVEKEKKAPAQSKRTDNQSTETHSSPA